MKFYTGFPCKPALLLTKIPPFIKFSFLLLLAIVIQGSTCCYGQTITLKAKQEPLRQILQKIRAQSSYDYLLDAEVEKKAKPITVDIKNLSVTDALDKCLEKQPLVYSIVEHTIIIREREAGKVKTRPAAATKDIDTVIVVGQVTNKAHQPLSGATVLFKSSGKGVTTDLKGRYFIKTNNANDSLLFRYIGYKTVTRSVRAVSGEATIDIILEETNNDLDQVMIKGYSTTTKRRSTGDIAVVSGEELAKQPVMNPMLALQGKVPGVDITPVSGSASGPVKIEIRGRKGIDPNFTGDPLYIIDGVPLTILDLSGSTRGNAVDKNGRAFSSGFDQSTSNPSDGQSPFFGLDVHDIESITILKDADATAIYGSRGANGVILITTKKGKPGKGKFDFGVSNGVNFATATRQLLNTEQYLSMRREAFRNDGIIPTVTNAPDLLVFDPNAYTDWQKYFLGGYASTTNVYTSVSGGNEQTTYKINANYGSSRDLTTLSGVNQSAGLGFQLNNRSASQKLSYTLMANYSGTRVNQLSFNTILALAPNAPPAFNSLGDLNYDGWSTARQEFPFTNLLLTHDNHGYALRGGLQVDYHIAKGWTLDINLGYNSAQSNVEALDPIAAHDPIIVPAPTGSATFSTTRNATELVEPKLSYNVLLGQGSLSASIGATYQSTMEDGASTSGYGYVSDELLHTITNAATITARDELLRYKYLGFFGFVNYSLDDGKYNINVSGRRDGSSHFGPANRFGNFWSIGGSWNATQEKWIRSWLPDFISSAHVQASIGITGSDPISDYKYLSQYGNNSGYPPYNGIPALNPEIQPNADFHWQVNRNKEISMALAFLKDRINVNVAYSVSRCNNQLISFPTPELSGFNSVIANSPADVENTSWEFAFSGRLIDGNDFKWTMSTSYTIPKNVLLAYPNLDQSPYKNTLKIGTTINNIYLLNYTGVNPLTGFYTFDDRNHDGKINGTSYLADPTGDAYVPMNQSKKFTLGLGNNFSYKRFSLSAFFNIVKQMGRSYLPVSTESGISSNMPVDLYNERWQYPGQQAIASRLMLSDPKATLVNFQQSTGAWTDASFIRLSSLAFSYSFPESIVHKLGLSNLAINIQGSNVFVLSKYKGIDPEVQGFGNILPYRTITGGLSASL